MIDWITRVIQPIVPIKREEWTKSILMFFYFFFTITTLYILKPIRNSIFLEELVKSLLQDSSDVNKICRQTPYWLRLKEKFKKNATV